MKELDILGSHPRLRVRIIGLSELAIIYYVVELNNTEVHQVV
jgi:hypothetical protein